MSFNQFPAHFPSLCIPRVFANITERRIFDTLNKLGLGDIARIVIVPKVVEKGKKFNCVFIHWNYWYNNRNADTARQRILDGQDFKVIYDDPWFWKVYEYKPQPDPTVLHNRTAPRIVFEDRPRPMYSIPRYLPVQEPRSIRSTTQMPCPDKEYRRHDTRHDTRREQEEKKRREQEEKMRREQEEKKIMEQEEKKIMEQEMVVLTREEIYALEVADTVAKNTRQLAPPPMSKQAAKLNAMKKV